MEELHGLSGKLLGACKRSEKVELVRWVRDHLGEVDRVLCILVVDVFPGRQRAMDILTLDTKDSVVVHGEESF